MKKILVLIIVILTISTACQNETKKDVVENQKEDIIKYKKKIINPLGMEFVYIKPGTFDMGVINEPSVTSGRIYSKTHKVTLTKGFYIQTTETTIKHFKEFVEKTQYKTQSEKNKLNKIYDIKYDTNWEPGFSWKNPGYEFNDNYPVTLISWEDVQAFIKWLNKTYGNYYRLPTEAEWEYSCRAGTKTNFSNGDLKYTALSKDGEKPDPTLDKIAWYSANSEGKPHHVGLKEPNQWGLHDMHGNVFEFCQDDYIYSFNSEHVTNPLYKSNDKSSKIAARGGGWWYYPFCCTSSSRSFFKKNYCSNVHGFRVIKDIVPKDLIEN